MVARLLVVLSSLLVLEYGVFAQGTDNVTADGTARMEWDDDQTREAATKNAYKDAIRKTLIGMYGEQAVRANELKLAPVYSDAKTYILESQQVAEKQDQALKTLSIKLNITVDKDALKGFLSEKGISLTSEKSMMVLPLIVEKSVNSVDSSGDFWWKNSKNTDQKRSFSDIEKALSLYFAQSGFSLIDPYQNSLASQVPESYRYMDLKVSELMELGKNFNVGLVANGYVKTECKKNSDEDNVDCSSVVSVQMISSDTGKIIASKRAVENGSSKNMSDARTVSRAKACQTVASNILSMMTKNWQKRAASSYRLVFKGVKDYPSYSKLRNCLMSGDISGVSNIIERYMAKNWTVFEVEKRGTNNPGQTILAKCYPEGKASILDQSENFVEIKIP